MLITGMPGIGKTSLAVASAHAVRASFPGGRLFLSLNAHDPRNPPLDTASALHRLLRMLDVPTGRIPHVLERRSAMWRAEMARRQLMVVLDDVADAAQVRPLLPPASGCKFIITSRDRLIGVATAVPLVLGALPTPEGVHLFTQVAGPSGAEASGMAEEIVQRCVGHPLAIRLAALSLRDGHPATAAELLDELVRPPGVSDVGDGVSDQILAVFELSYQGLAESARRMLRRLALHPGTDITTYAAAALDGATLPQAEAALAMLTDRNLLAGSRELFRLHDLVRRYAAARASRDDPERAVRQAFDRLADYYRLSLKQANRVRNPATPAPAEPAPARPVSIPPMETPLEASGWLELEWHNVLCTARQAAKRERKNHCAGLIHALSQWLEATGHWNEAAESHALALQASRELGDERGAARACLDLSLVSRATGRAADALLHAEAAAARYRRLADQIGLADALNQIGTLHKDAARYREALAYHKEAREFYGAAGHVPGVASTLNQSGIACCHLGRYRIATDHIQSALGIFRQLGDRRGEAKTLNNLGRIYRNQGYHRDALRSYQDALKIFDEIGGEQSQSILCQNIGGVHHYKGNHEKAIVSYRRALAICRRIGDLPGEVNVLNDMGVTFQAMDDHAEALANHQRAEVMATELGDLNERVTALRGMADAYRGQGHHGEALDHYERALRLSREISEPYQEGKVLNGIAETTLQTQGAEAARIYWHQAYDLFQQLGVAEAETVRLRLDTLPPEQPSGVS
jgi:tetratricopeptide (TPR) repeat protein